MKRSKFSDEQILAIVKEGEAGRKVADLCRANPFIRYAPFVGGRERVWPSAGSTVRVVGQPVTTQRSAHQVRRGGLIMTWLCEGRNGGNGLWSLDTLAIRQVQRFATLSVRVGGAEPLQLFNKWIHGPVPSNWPLRPGFGSGSPLGRCFWVNGPARFNNPRIDPLVTFLFDPAHQTGTESNRVRKLAFGYYLAARRPVTFVR